MERIAVLVLVVGAAAVLALIARRLGVGAPGGKPGPGAEGPPPYRKRGSLLSAAELAFYEVLVRAVGGIDGKTGRGVRQSKIGGPCVGAARD